ncbi:RlpA-like double-psi beta-barrel-protein domain-containing protein-containing protein [Cokeromyces recurvatus]|uniref:RlpA-like double-psi beta-barrel-protein domain-containing protein-containing protein n=1 Tax=Cokeromyces recurvatus TaxID=90255 RepID=UPI00221FE170|nr:RlpA-like double-psi beta-barrel-protein domain-containing protein-containing protein [Cokeromyces recurvatus]KAI7902197.1 RlpA-like double-psi beta-barrel-protein domain-containing protein-containing protein [Cokeromyces recurvatus]
MYSMKIQFLISYFMVFLFAFTSARPLTERGLAGNIVNTVKKLLHHGIGTFFDPESEGGAQGACGPYADENSQIVAMNAVQYGNLNKKSHWCGKKLKICSKGKCTIATVTDACPACKKGCLDLTPAVWGQLESDYNKGIIPIEWDIYDGEDDEST